MTIVEYVSHTSFQQGYKSCAADLQIRAVSSVLVVKREARADQC